MKKRERLLVDGVRERHVDDSTGVTRPVGASPRTQRTARVRAGIVGEAVGMAGTAVFVVLSLVVTVVLVVLGIRGWIMGTAHAAHGLGQDLALAGLSALLLVAVVVAAGGIGYVIKRHAPP